jgi:hypothetical protein
MFAQGIFLGRVAASRMPRACPVEAHVSRYTRRPHAPFFPRIARGGFAAAGNAAEAG